MRRWRRMEILRSGRFSGLAGVLAALCCLAVVSGALPVRAATVAPCDALALPDPVSGGFIGVPAVLGGPEEFGESTGLGESGEGAAAPAAAQSSRPAGPAEVRLSAMPGETVAFQLVFRWKPGERLENIGVDLDLPGALSVRAFRAWCIWDTPEVAVPLDGGAPPFDLPSRLPMERELFAEKGYRTWSAWVELTVPRGAGPEPMEGAVSVSWSGERRAVFPVRVDLLPVQLPYRPTFVMEMNSYGDWKRLLPVTARTYVGLHRLFRRFRTTFVQVPYRQDGTLPLPFLAPRVIEEGGRVRLDWTAFDKALSGLFDGDAFPDGQPLSHYLLPLSAWWPVPFNELGRDPAHWRRVNVEVRRQMAERFRARGWGGTRFEEFHNETPVAGKNGIAWRLDEPVTEADLNGYELFLDLRDAAAKGAAVALEDVLPYRVDISQWRELRPQVERLGPRVRDWAVSMLPQYLDAGTVDLFRKLSPGWLLAYGEFAGFNGGGKPLPLSTIAGQIVRLGRLGVDGAEQWAVDYWRHKAVPRPGAPDETVPYEAVPLFYANAAGGRDFIWPAMFFGPEVSSSGALPSLRLLAVRDAVNLLDLAHQVRALHPKASVRVDRALAAVDGADWRTLRAARRELVAILRGE